MSAGTSRLSKISSVSGMPRNPSAGSRLPMISPLGGVGRGWAHEDEPADALLGAALVEHPREHQVQSRHAAARDPMLLAIEDIDVAALVGARCHLRCCAAGPGLGDADGRLVAR